MLTNNLENKIMKKEDKTKIKATAKAKHMKEGKIYLVGAENAKVLIDKGWATKAK